VSERGEYRPIYTVLVHGADYQELSPFEKLVFLHCKLNLNAAGIGVLYASVLADQTGLSDEQVRLALTTLEHRGWVRVERNVIWIVDGLKYEPSVLEANGPHRKWLARHVAGLPNLSIVNAFRARYASWFDSPPAGPLEAPSIPPRSTTTTTTTTTKRLPAARAAKPRAVKYPHFSRDACDRLYTLWCSLFGHPPYAAFRSAFGPLFPDQPLYTLEQVEAAMREYAEDMRGDEAKFASVVGFVSRVRHYVDMTTPIAQRDPVRARALGIIA
jgi:hypothetical protein